MAYTTSDYLPTYEELNVPELKLSSPVLRAGSYHFGKYCDDICKEFMLCRAETGDPRKCINEGKEVTRCGFEFFGQVKKNCPEEFRKYWTCVDRGGCDMPLSKCRKPQAVFDKCIKDKMDLERPPIGYFSMVRIHKSSRPPPEEKLPVFPEPVPEARPVAGREPKSKEEEWPRYNIIN